MKIDKTLHAHLVTDVISTLISWLDEGHSVALATVISTWGSSPFPPGSHLIVRDDAAIVGSVSGGCVESAVIDESLKVIKGAPPNIFEYGISGEKAWEVGLACGGEIKVFIHKVDDGAALYRIAKNRIQEGFCSVLVTRMLDANSVLIGDGFKSGTLEISEKLFELSFKAAKKNQNFIFEFEGCSYFIQSINPPIRIIIVGAVHIAQALVHLAKVVGFEVVVIDPRKSFATPERFPGVEVLIEWPDKALKELNVNYQTAVICLTHDPKIDDLALKLSLKSSAFYIGALGSERTAARRNIRLAKLGLELNDLRRIHGPIGLDIGSKSSAEIAVSILAEIIQEIKH